MEKGIPSIQLQKATYNAEQDLAAALGYSRAQFLGDAGSSIDNVSISNVNRSHLRGDLTGYTDTPPHYINQNDRTWSRRRPHWVGKLIEPLTTPSLILKSIPPRRHGYILTYSLRFASSRLHAFVGRVVSDNY